VTFRQVDQPIFDALVAISHEQKCNLTSVFRIALSEFVKTKSKETGQKLDEFLENSAIAEPIYNRMLTPAELRSWSDSEVLRAAKLVRARKAELDLDLRRRGYFIRW
jgi:hypothetical protein